MFQDVTILSIPTSRFIPTIPDLAWSPARGRERPEYAADGNTENICRHWAGISTGKHNQDVSFALEGQKGTGKSSTSLTLCVNTAKWEAEFLGDDWRDHFDLERTAAIIDTEKSDEVMLNSGKYDVRLFDDISLAWGNRNWQSDENKDKNDIFIINRIDNTVNILTTPNTKLIDVVPRSNVNFKGEMDSPYFNFGYTSMKVFKPIPMYRAAGYRVMDPFMKVGRDKIVVYMVEAPPKKLWDEYNKERERATEAVKKQRKESMAVRRGDAEPAESVSTIQKKRKQPATITTMNADIDTYMDKIHAVVVTGGQRKDIQSMLTKELGNYQKAGRWAKSEYLKTIYPDLK